MDSIYLIIVIVLLGLAVLDLVVGVANDAVNLHSIPVSAPKVAPLWAIFTVASLGADWFTLFEWHDGGSPKRRLLSGKIYLSHRHDALPRGDAHRRGLA